MKKDRKVQRSMLHLLSGGKWQVGSSKLLSVLKHLSVKIEEGPSPTL